MIAFFDFEKSGFSVDDCFLAVRILNHKLALGEDGDEREMVIEDGDFSGGRLHIDRLDVALVLHALE